MKFKYINSNEEEALYEANPLTRELYTSILEADKNFLKKVSENQDCQFNEAHIEAAKEMLENYGKGKDGVYKESKDDTSLILVAVKKEVIKKGETSKKKSSTPKAFLRQFLASSSIRMFKKDKMTIVLGA
jgi:hypothetical protein